MRAVVLALLAAVPPIGVGPPYRPAAVGPERAPAGLLARCGPQAAGASAIHLELFVAGRTVIVPAGIGARAPRRDGASVRRAACWAPLWTVEPTGVVRLSRVRPWRLGDLFAVWRQPLGPRRLVAATARDGQHVCASVNGRPWSGDPRRIPLRHHAQIVLQLGTAVPAHAAYRFPPGV